MAWLYLVLGGLCEAAWVTLFKSNGGFTFDWRGGLALALVVAGPLFASLAMRELPVTTAYFVWVGAASIGVFAAGYFLFNENISMAKMACIGLILFGALGLKFLGVADKV